MNGHTAEPSGRSKSAATATPAAGGHVPAPQEPSPALLATARSLPKVLLHEHLDGGLREATLLELLHARGLPAPAADVPGLMRWFDERAHAGSLEDYLKGFALTVAAMATPKALERVACEAAEDARLDGCVLAEFRIAPLLFEPLGVPGDAAVEAMLAGLARSPLPSGLIVCAMRHESDAQIARAAELALRWQGRGVIAFDLAGPEAGWPATRHAALLARLRAEGLPLTLHAGEADEGLRVLEAARLGAARVGHGVRLADLIDGSQGAAVLQEVRDSGLHLEVCPTSNVQTGAALSIAQHPIRALWEAGVSLSFHTDNHLISCTDMNSEGQALLDEAGFALHDLARMQALALEASFLAEDLKTPARAALAAWHANPTQPDLSS